MISHYDFGAFPKDSPEGVAWTEALFVKHTHAPAGALISRAVLARLFEKVDPYRPVEDGVLEISLRLMWPELRKELVISWTDMEGNAMDLPELVVDRVSLAVTRPDSVCVEYTYHPHIPVTVRLHREDAAPPLSPHA